MIMPMLMTCAARAASGSNGASIARHASRRAAAPSPPAHGRAGCAACRPRSARRCGGCRDARRAGPNRAACARASSQQRLGLARHQHDRAVVEHDAVAVAQRHRLVEIEQEIGAALALQHDAAAMPVVGIEQHPVDRRGRIPVARAADRQAALHIGLAAGAAIMRRTNSRRRAMPETTTLKGKYSAAGEGNVYARANTATCKITAADTDGTFEIFDEQCKPGFEFAPAHAHQVVPGLLRGRRQRRIPARRGGVPRQEGRLREHPAGRAAQGRLQGRHAHADGVLARPAWRA